MQKRALPRGLFWRWAGDGIVKLHLPDAHSDFIFAVAAEEYGAIACLALLGALWICNCSRVCKGVIGRRAILPDCNGQPRDAIRRSSQHSHGIIS